jgi:hypothetical protein
LIIGYDYFFVRRALENVPTRGEIKSIEAKIESMRGDRIIIKNTGKEEINNITIIVNDKIVNQIAVNIAPNESATIELEPPLEANETYKIIFIASGGGGSFVFEITIPASEATPSEGYIYLSPCEPPSQGNWIVNTSTLCIDRTIILNGNITIQTGGEITYPELPFYTALFFQNVDLYVNSSYPNEFGIEVGDMGAFYIFNSTITSLQNESFFFGVRPGSTFQVNDSVISHCGFNSTNLAERGLFIDTDNVIISGSKILENYVGIVLNSSVNTLILNNEINQNNIGVYCIESDPSFVGNLFANNTDNCSSCPRCPI